MVNLHITVAIDSLKGSLSSLEAGYAAKDGILRVYPSASVDVFSVADGGEGTVDALTGGMHGRKQTVLVTGPLGNKVSCQYGIVDNTTAIVEMSAAAGITLVERDKLNPLYTTTYGVGEMIIDAANKGCRNFIIGIGGSATNDGGVGMLQALGFDIVDKNGISVPRGAIGLRDVAAVSCDNAFPLLKECTFNIACDVTNPLCGENGCSAVYGPQKGATSEMVRDMDNWLSRYADIVKSVFPDSDKNTAGAGAAGGIGFAFVSFLNARLSRGIDLVLELIQIEKSIQSSDIVVTGEGRLDSQSVMGKTPVGIANIAKKYNKPVIAFSGCVASDAGVCNQYGIDAYFPIVQGACSLEDAMNSKNACSNMQNTVEQAFRLVKTLVK